MLIAKPYYINKSVGKCLICDYARKKDFYEIYLLFNKTYIENPLILNDYKFTISQNKSKAYFSKNNHLKMPPFKTHIEDLEVLDTEFIN